MNLAKRDHMIFQMKAELENRKKMLCSKRKEMKKNVSENGLLNQVLADYSKYNQDIVNQKREQIDFLKLLHEYVGNVSHDIHATSTLLKESRTDQREILKEINHLKHDLEELME
jgi:hypothetical protein